MTMVKFQDWECALEFHKFQNGQHALMLVDAEDGMGITRASVALEAPLEPDEIAIKDWSENEGMVEVLFWAKVIKMPHRYIPSGFVQVPICKLLVQPA